MSAATISSDIVLEDTTLRDGEQAPGVGFDIETKVKICTAMINAGVRWIEAGIPAMGGDEKRALRRMRALDGEATLVAWNRGVRADVEESLEMGFEAIHIGLPASDHLLDSSVRRDRRWLLEQAASLIGLAKDHGAFVSISAEDVGRADRGFLTEYAAHVAAAGADRLRLSDTIGVLTPEGYAQIVTDVRTAASIDVQCHAHNDFGLAVANTLAGLCAGARWFHVTINGIGERAGMPDFATTLLALRQLYGVDVGIDLRCCGELSALVTAATGIDLPPWYPVVGSNAFAHESGIHVNALLRDGAAFEPFDPHTVGRERRLVLGKHSGRALVREMLANRGVTATEVEISECLRVSRERAIRDQKGVDPELLLELLEEVRGANAAR